MVGSNDTIARSSPTRPSAERRWSAENLRLLLYMISLGLDMAAVASGFALAAALGPANWVEFAGFPILLIALCLFVMFSVGLEAQSSETLQDSQVGIQRAFYALVAAFIAQLMLFFATQVGEDVSRLGFSAFFVASGVCLVLSRLIQRIATRLLLGPVVTSTVLLLDGRQLEGDPGMTVIDLTARELWPDLHQPAMVSAISNEINGFDRVIVACREERYLPWSMFLQGADIAGEIVVGNDRLRGAIGIGRCALQDTLIISRGPLSIGNRIKKRTFDLVVASALLVCLAPLLVTVAVLIRLESPGPAFFRQLRIGKGNRYFEIVKFRSMRWEQSDPAGDVSTVRQDPRITRLGAFIRRTSIDELPQLINVVKGHMSLVGPRPHALGSLAGSQPFWDVDERYWQRHSLRPGITGLAQIRGFRGSTDDVADLENRLRCDLEYLSNWSLMQDARILLATIAVIMHDKAY